MCEIRLLGFGLKIEQNSNDNLQTNSEQVAAFPY
jgi:hypothetical protein